MVTNQHVRRLSMLIKTQKTMAIAAAKAGMDEKTARKAKKRPVTQSLQIGTHLVYTI
jgi:hypothetical protein